MEQNAYWVLSFHLVDAGPKKRSVTSLLGVTNNDSGPSRTRNEYGDGINKRQ